MEQGSKTIVTVLITILLITAISAASYLAYDNYKDSNDSRAQNREQDRETENQPNTNQEEEDSNQSDGLAKAVNDARIKLKELDTTAQFTYKGLTWNVWAVDKTDLEEMAANDPEAGASLYEWALISSGSSQCYVPSFNDMSNWSNQSLNIFSLYKEYECAIVEQASLELWAMDGGEKIYVVGTYDYSANQIVTAEEILFLAQDQELIK